MRVFITGSESFVGKELISQLIKRSMEVIGCDLVEAPSQQYEYYKADIRSSELGRAIPMDMDAIIHLAALSRDQDCKGRAFECFDVNVMGTLNAMKCAAEKKAKQFIFASSEWVYDNCTEEDVKTEESIINIANHTSEYALSKLVSEANLKQGYVNSFCPVTILRFGIIYGQRKEGGAAIEAIARAVWEKNEIEIGCAKTGRHFIHISDVVSGIIMAIGLEGFEIINLCGNELITLQDIIETSQKILGRNAKIIDKNTAVSIRRISNTKAKKILNWEQKITLEQGLKLLLKN